MNVVALIGNLTRDPELRYTSGGTAVTSLRLAFNDREKDASGNWVDRANYIDVTVWGKQAENAAQYLAKGRKVGVHGRLRWEEWESDSGKRQAIKVVAMHVEFLTPKGGDGTGPVPESQPWGTGDASDFDPGTTDDNVDFAATGTDAGDDGIPF